MSVQTYPRKDWGAKDPAHPPTRLPSSAIDELVVHYSSMDAERRMSHDDCPGVVRAIQAFHQNSRGWSDIGYSWLTCQHGGVFEGRGWNVYPAATLNHNFHTQAVCFLGGDKEGRDDVTVAGREALAHVVREFHRVTGPGKVVGHRDRVSTSCPGDELHAWVLAEGWRVAAPKTKPWPLPVPGWFWLWAKWRRAFFNYPSAAEWRDARPAGVPPRIPDWAWVRLAAMTPKP
jgi:hypothetical protein